MATMFHNCSGGVVPAVIVGGGRVGTALLGMRSGEDVLVRRGQSFPTNFHGPIFICTRNDDLDGVLQAIPSSHRPNLVFFQNGMLDPWFKSKGLIGVNQVLAYFAILKIGDPPLDGKTDQDPDGLTAAYGKWAFEVAARLDRGGLSCKVLDKDAFQKQMLEKLIWLCSFMLAGARHLCATVGEVERKYRSEVGSLILELASAASEERNIVFDNGMEERLCAYSRAVSHFPVAMKEFKWRNGWFFSLTEKAISEGRPDPCALHTAWLQELKFI